MIDLMSFLRRDDWVVRTCTVIVVLTVIAVLAILSACAGNPQDGMSERERIIAELAVSGATMRFVDDRKPRARKVKAAVEVVRVAVSDDPTLTVERLNELMLEQIPEGSLNPFEAEAARAIVALVIVDLGEFVPGQGVLDPETRALVLRYAAAVERGADAVLSA